MKTIVINCPSHSGIHASAIYEIPWRKVISIAWGVDTAKLTYRDIKERRVVTFARADNPHLDWPMAGYLRRDIYNRR